MFRILIFSCLFLCYRCKYDPKKDYSKYEEIDPTKHDYCEENCDPKAKSPDDGGGTHVACDCTPVGDRQLYKFDDLDAVIEFRQDIVDSHNHWRNFSASGRETRPENDSIPSAADMEVVNYDLELEYIARCRALNSFFTTTNPHEKCVEMAGGRPYGQNVALDRVYKKHSSEKNWETDRIKGMYDEVRYLPNASIVKKFDNNMPLVNAPPDGKLGHWSAMIWHTVNRVGCVRSYLTDNAMDKTLKYALICNYACDHTFTSSNVQGWEMFKIGEPCSSCPKNKKCNDKYTALCGELKPIPTAPPWKSNSPRMWHCCYCSGLAMFLLNYTLCSVLYKWFL